MLLASTSSARETCDVLLNAGSSSIDSIKSAMGFSSCDLKSVFDYRASTKDIWINCGCSLCPQILLLCGVDGIYPVQRGVSAHHSMLGSRQERVHHTLAIAFLKLFWTLYGTG